MMGLEQTELMAKKWKIVKKINIVSWTDTICQNWGNNKTSNVNPTTTNKKGFKTGF